MPEAAVQWTSAELEAMRPPADITITEWAESRRVLERQSAIKGLWQRAMTPLLAVIQDTVQDPDVDEVVLCKPAQFGGTVMATNVGGYYIDEEAAPVGMVLADQATSNYVSSKKWRSMFEDSEELRRLWDPALYSQDEIDFRNGAYLGMAWASSVGMLGTRSFRIMIFDEVDKPGYYVMTKEADPISLGRERTETYPAGYRKHLILSTPTLLETSNIIRELDACHIVYDWHVPCPACGLMQPLRWGQDARYCYGFEDGLFRGEDGAKYKLGRVAWEGGREATREQVLRTARYECGGCGARWATQQKNEAVGRGRMVPRTDPRGGERKIGFHANRIYSLFDGGRLEALVQNWVSIWEHQGTKRSKLIQGFINSTLAEPWHEVVISSSRAEILKARCKLPAMTVPETAIALTAGVDVQKRGFWFLVRAWARDYVSWMIHYGFLTAWGEVEDLLFGTSYPVQDTDLRMRIWRAGMDTGGGAGEGEDGLTMTEATYFWIRKNGLGRGCRVYPCKGSSSPLASKVHVGKMLDKTPSGKPIPGGLQNILIDTGQVKDMVYYRLTQAAEEGEQAAYLHAGTGEDYARQILAEEKRLDPKKGTHHWVQIREGNHLLDCEGLCQVVAEPEWPGGGINILKSARKEARKPAERDVPRTPRNWQRSGGYRRPNWLNRQS